jgi:hypothetical protein
MCPLAFLVLLPARGVNGLLIGMSCGVTNKEQPHSKPHESASKPKNG